MPRTLTTPHAQDPATDGPRIVAWLDGMAARVEAGTPGDHTVNELLATWEKGAYWIDLNDRRVHPRLVKLTHAQRAAVRELARRALLARGGRWAIEVSTGPFASRSLVVVADAIGIHLELPP